MEHVLVTGGSSGIGREIVKLLHQKKYKVTFTFNSRHELAQALEGDCPGTKGFVVDQADIDHLHARLSEVESERGPFDHLVNNAGITRDAHFALQDEEKWREVINVNLDGVAATTRFVIRHMLHQRKGRVVNLTSSSGISGLPGQTAYSASKAGLIGFTKALAQEVARYQILVNAVAPGLIDTPMIEHLSDKRKKELMERIPLERLGKPEDVAQLVYFLISPQCQFITGQVLRIDGGMLMA